LSGAAKHVDETEHPYSGPHREDAGYGVKVVTLRDQLLGEFRTVTLILLCAVAAVLLIACVNVAILCSFGLYPGKRKHQSAGHLAQPTRAYWRSGSQNLPYLLPLAARLA
jgi:hypothetical protein